MPRETTLDPQPLERPIFVFASGWRAGSTLLQRLLGSHPEVLIWGESRGLVGRLVGAWEGIESLERLSVQHWEAFDREGTQAWIALMNPPLDDFACALRALLERYYAVPARQLGRSRWGYKEVRDDADSARLLARLYPGARFLLLFRHPEACLASARATMREDQGLLVECGGPEAFLAHWLRLAQDLLHVASQVPGLVVRYESLVEDPSAALDEIGRFLGLDPSQLDGSLMDHPVRGWGGEPRLEAADVRALRSEPLWRVAAQLGYAPRKAPPGRIEGLRRRLASGRLR